MTTTAVIDRLELSKKLPNGRQGDFGSIYLLKSDGGLIGIDTISKSAIDENNLTVRMRISTDERDRVNHSVNQSGMILDLYKENPVVLYGHGLEGITLPVALSEDREGNLTVVTEEDGTYATAYHNQDNIISMQLFDLVSQKFIRTSSIGIDIVDASIGYPRNDPSDETLFIEKCILNEWSYCTIPMNPGAKIIKSHALLAETLGLQCEVANAILKRNKLDGRTIDPSIRKSLEAYVGTKASTRGISPQQDQEQKTMGKKLTLAEIKKLGPKGIAKSMNELSEYDEETRGAIKFAAEMLPDDNTIKPDESDANKSDLDPLDGDESDLQLSDPLSSNDIPLGAQVIRSLHDAILEQVEIASKALGPVEAEDVKSTATGVIEQMRELATSLEGVYSQKYASLDLEPLVPSADEPTDDVVKSFLGRSSRGRDQLVGLAARISMVAKHARSNGGKLGDKHLKILAQTGSDLGRLNDQAKSYKPEQSGEDVTQIKEALKSFSASMSSFADVMDKLPQPIKA